MAAVKTCVTCAFFVSSKAGGEYGKCSRIWKEEPVISPVTGKKSRGEHWFASTMRSNDCGENGEWWEPNSVELTWRKPKQQREKQDGWWVRTVKRVLS